MYKNMKKNIILIGLVMLALGLVLFGVAHATTAPTPNFTIDIVSQAGVYTIEVVPNFNLTNNAEIKIVTASGYVMFSQNFTNTFSYSTPLYQTSIVQIFYGGVLITSKVIDVTPTPTSVPLLTMGENDAIIVSAFLLILAVYDKYIFHRISRREKADWTYDEDMGTEDMRDALELEKMGVITQAQAEWLKRMMTKIRKNGYEVSLSDILTPQQKDVLKVAREARKNA